MKEGAGGQLLPARHASRDFTVGMKEAFSDIPLTWPYRRCTLRPGVGRGQAERSPCAGLSAGLQRRGRRGWDGERKGGHQGRQRLPMTSLRGNAAPPLHVLNTSAVLHVMYTLTGPAGFLTSTAQVSVQIWCESVIWFCSGAKTNPRRVHLAENIKQLIHALSVQWGHYVAGVYSEHVLKQLFVHQSRRLNEMKDLRVRDGEVNL